jgi:hypothetical protein
MLGFRWCNAFSDLVNSLKITQMILLVVAGDWSEVEILAAKINLKKHKTLYYALYKQHYLELIDRQEYQKVSASAHCPPSRFGRIHLRLSVFQAFSFLNKYLKPLEYRSAGNENNEFADLCSLLTCKSVQEVYSLFGMVHMNLRL